MPDPNNQAAARPTPPGLPAEGAEADAPRSPKPAPDPEEVGGPSGPEPTRYGDWEIKGIAVDF